MKTRCLVYFLAVVTLLFIFVALSGCATQNAGLSRSPLTVYMIARAAFNDYLETYLDYRDALPNGPEKTALRQRFEPRFMQAAALLDLWKTALGRADENSARKAFNEAFNALLNELITAGIIKPAMGG
ncbi:MAG: hypothetical protein JRJ03_18405 [Deltaproteobacteria bacterium]|nr:hypothetical protein [Deltaproteobacteria bacterium]